MIGDKLDGAVLALLIGGGAAVLLGVVGMVDQPLAERIWLYLVLTGSAAPFLAVVAVEVIIRAKNSNVQRRLDAAKAWAKELENQRGELAIQEAMAQPTPPPVVFVTDDAARLHAWKVAMLRAIMYAEIYDWPFDTLGPEGVSVMDRPDWDAVTDHLRDCAILHKREKSRTRYLEYWDANRARAEVRQGLPLPYPAGPAPVVHSLRCTEAQETQIAQAALKSGLDALAKALNVNDRCFRPVTDWGATGKPGKVVVTL